MLSQAFAEPQLHTAFFDWLFIELLHFNQLPPAVLFYITIAIIFLQGIAISVLLRVYKITPKLNLVPAAVYYILFYLFDEFIVFSPLLLTNFLVIVLLIILFNVYNQKKADATFFNAGFLSGIICLLYFPAVVLILFSIYALFALRSSSIRELFVFISGIFTILFLVFTACFWFDATQLLLNTVMLPLSHSSDTSIGLIEYIKCFLLACLLLPSLLFVSNRSGSVLIQIRKYLAAIIVLAFFGFIAGFLYSSISLPAFILAIIPCSIFIGYYFSYLKNRDSAEIIHLTCLGIIFAFQYINFAG